MAWLVVLDSGPLGSASKPLGKPDGDESRVRLNRLVENGARIIIPEIADYEVRRELLRVGNPKAVARMNQLRITFLYDPITTAVMEKAAEFWAASRRRGRPTSHPQSLDGDVILAAHATLLAGPGDKVTVATSNVGHLARFVDARDWTTIV